MGYKLVTYDAGKGPRAGIIAGDQLIDAADASGNAAYSTMLGVLADWATADKKFTGLADAATKGIAVDWKQILAPVPLPGAIYCAGANYNRSRERNERRPGSRARTRSAHARPQALALHQVLAPPSSPPAPPSRFHRRRKRWIGKSS